MNTFKILGYIQILVFALAIGLYQKYAPHLNYRNLKQEKKSRGVIQIQDNVFSDQQIQQLKSIVRKTGLITGHVLYKSDYEYASSEFINNKCPGKYDHYDIDLNKCVLAGRVDIAKHTLLSGGSLITNKKYDDLSSKFNVFQGYFNLDGENKVKQNQQIQIFQNYINSKEYEKLIEPICGFQNPYLVNNTPQITLTLPGQENPQHFDIGDMYGISSALFPPWLLIAMNNSGLFDDMKIPTIQGVTYVHSWNNTQQDKGGQIRVWEYGPGFENTVYEALPGRVVLFDGTRIAHETITYKPEIEPQYFDKNFGYIAYYNGQNWDIYNTLTGELYLKIMDDDDTRISIVWRQQCFKTEQDAIKHEELIKNGGSVTVEYVVDKMINNLVEEGKISKNMIPKTEIDKAELIIDNYIEYSFNGNEWFPYNFCIILEFTIPSYILDFIGFQQFC